MISQERINESSRFADKTELFSRGYPFVTCWYFPNDKINRCIKVEFYSYSFIPLVLEDKMICKYWVLILSQVKLCTRFWAYENKCEFYSTKLIARCSIFSILRHMKKDSCEALHIHMKISHFSPICKKFACGIYSKPDVRNGVQTANDLSILDGYSN